MEKKKITRVHKYYNFQFEANVRNTGYQVFVIIKARKESEAWFKAKKHHPNYENFRNLKIVDIEEGKFGKEKFIM